MKKVERVKYPASQPLSLIHISVREALYEINDKMMYYGFDADDEMNSDGYELQDLYDSVFDNN